MFEIKDEKKDAITIVDVEGEITSSSSTSLEKHLDELLNTDESRFVIGCDKLDLITSAGLRVLLAFAKKLEKIQGSLSLGGMSENVYEVFEMSGFTGILKIYPTREEAVSSLSQP